MRNVTILLILLMAGPVLADSEQCKVKSPGRIECRVEYFAPAGESDTVRFILDGLETLERPGTIGLIRSTWISPGVIVQENWINFAFQATAITFTNTTNADLYGTALLIYETRRD